MPTHRTHLYINTDDSTKCLDLIIEADYTIRKGEKPRMPDLNSPGDPGCPDEIEVTAIRLVHDVVAWPCPMWLTNFIHESLDQDTMMEAASD